MGTLRLAAAVLALLTGKETVLVAAASVIHKLLANAVGAIVEPVQQRLVAAGRSFLLGQQAEFYAKRAKLAQTPGGHVKGETALSRFKTVRIRLKHFNKPDTII